MKMIFGIKILKKVVKYLKSSKILKKVVDICWKLW